MPFFRNKKGDYQISQGDRIRYVMKDLVETRSWGERRFIVIDNADILLNFGAEIAINSLIAKQQDPALVKTLRELQFILRSCRRFGINETFFRYFPNSYIPPSPDRMSRELRLILHALDEPIRSSQEMPRQIDLHRRALELVKRDYQPELWGTLHNDVANRLTANPQGNRADNIEQAIDHYQQALEVLTRDSSPTLWAACHSNLAIAYYFRIRGEHADNLEQAITYYQKTLEVADRVKYPDGWAQTLVNMSGAYRDRILGDHSDNLEKAISLCQESLSVYTYSDHPDDWAAVQANLGTAFFKRFFAGSFRGFREKRQLFQKLVTHISGKFAGYFSNARHPQMDCVL